MAATAISARERPNGANMSDVELRGAERRFRARADDLEAVEALLRAYDRAGKLAPASVLRRSARWQPLIACVDRWYSDPIGGGDGVSERELLGAEKRLGTRLPNLVREWHLLVGARLQPVQDSPATLKDLRADDLEAGRVVLWVENQGCWTVEAPLAGDGPAMVVWGEPDVPAVVAPVREALLGMLMSDTLVGAWAGRGQGTLGPLRPQVVGGCVDSVDRPTLDRLRARYATLDLQVGPSHSVEGQPQHGDRETLIRFDSYTDRVEWMVASADALGRLRDVLRREERENRLVVGLSGLTRAQVRPLTNERLLSLARQAAGDTGGPLMVGDGPSGLIMEIATDDPDGTFARLRALLPGLDTRLVAGARCDEVALFRPLWPPGASAFVSPF